MNEINKFLSTIELESNLIINGYKIVNLNDNLVGLTVRGENWVLYFDGNEIARNFSKQRLLVSGLIHYIEKVYKFE